MHINRSIKPQQQRIKYYASTSDAFSLFNQLTSPELFDTLESTLTAPKTVREGWCVYS